MKHKAIPYLFVLGLIPALTPVFAQEDVAVGQKGMVASVSPDASDVGLAILKKGGNAVDAAIATALAMAVTHPSAGNIGGGGFMMIHPGNGGAPFFIDYREKAPAAVEVDTFATTRSHLGHKIVGVPGTVAGLELAHKRFGSLPWKDLVAPAVKLAKDGFVMHAGLARSLNGQVRRNTDFPEFVRVFGKDGGKAEWQEGDRLVQPDLAATLSRIAEQGKDGFYIGETARLVEEEMKAGGGFITAADLAAYEAVLRSPIHTTFRGWDVYGPPPPSSGGICLAQMLNVLENFDLAKKGRWSLETMHIITETMRRAYADRAKHLGDPDFVEIPEHLTSKEYAKKLAASINLERATKSAAIAAPIELANEGNETTHFSVIDGDGMAVSNTYTLEQGFGSKVVVRGAGFLLNNEMGDFNWRPGVTNQRGTIGTKANQMAPGKRMLSSMTPTIVSKDGVVRLITGSPGGRTIINTALCVVLNVLEFDMDIRAAVDAPRMHHQWFPDSLRFEGANDPVYGDLVEALQAMGHTVQRTGQGDAHSILVNDGTFYGAADRRTRGKASGW